MRISSHCFSFFYLNFFTFYTMCQLLKAAVVNRLQVRLLGCWQVCFSAGPVMERVQWSMPCCVTKYCHLGSDTPPTASWRWRARTAAKPSSWPKAQRIRRAYRFVNPLHFWFLDVEVLLCGWNVSWLCVLWLDGEPAGPCAPPGWGPGCWQHGLCHVAESQVCSAQRWSGVGWQVRLSFSLN